jgi:alpha-ketoglutarate-dependent taurine dioxygenase
MLANGLNRDNTGAMSAFESVPVTRESTDSTADILTWLGRLPTFNEVLTIFNGPFEPNTFVEGVEALDRWEIIASSDVQGDSETADKSKRSDHFDYHTDGFYLPEPPALFLLNCENPGTEGIQTSFVNTKELLQKLDDQLPILRILRFVYIGKTLERYSRPLIEQHPVDRSLITNLVTRGFVEPEVTLGTINRLPDFREINNAMCELYKAIADSTSYVHTWQAGDTVVCDNVTYIHARVADIPDPERKLYRIWASQTSPL